MNWTLPEDLRRQLQRLWDTGRILAAPLRGDPLFPFRLSLRAPNARSLSDQFDDVRAWIRQWEAGAGYQLEWTEINHRILGRNRIPSAVTVATEEDALQMIGKTHDATQFRDIAGQVRGRLPQLTDWLARKPLAALDCAADWPRLLDVLAWFRDHPRSGIYLRRIDIPGVDTKFIEDRKPLLTELLDLSLPPEAIDAAAPGWRNFERRYTLRPKPNLIRFRMLDRRFAIQGLTDLSVPAHEFAALQLPVSRGFITENEINGLAFPDVPESIVIFGLGYGLDRLADIQWLKGLPMHYWGDIDTHGFAMLDRLRAIFPTTESFLMDSETLFAHQHFWIHESAPYVGELSRLTAAEQSLYDDLRFDRLGDQVRLEQERIAFTYVERALHPIVSPASHPRDKSR